MIDEKRLKARMAALLKGIEKELPAMCKEIGARQRDMTVALASTFMTIVKMVDDLAEKGCWIPCSERLPDGRKDVIVTFGYEFPVIAWYSEVNKQWKNSSTDHVIHGEVVAWMPLPEPYKESE